MTPEGKIKNKARRVAHDRGYYTFPVNQSGLSRRGIPDDFIIVNRAPYFVEFKAHMRWDTNNAAAIKTLPTAWQIVEMSKAREAGICTLVVDDSNVNYYCDWLKGEITKDAMLEVCYWDITIRDMEAYKTAENPGDLLVFAITDVGVPSILWER